MLMQAIPLQPSQKYQAAGLYARAFFDYPMFTFYYPDRARRARHLASHFEVLVNYGFLYGQNYTTPGLTGAACWLPPGASNTTWWRIIRAGGLSIIPRIGFKRTWTHNLPHEDYLDKVHQEIVPGPHYYLWAVAVDPDYQGMGVGKALMKPGLDQAHAARLPIYLETHLEQNVPYYQKMGFKLVRAETLPGFDLKFWCLLRFPK